MSVLQADPLLPTLSPAELRRLQDEGGIEFVDGEIVEKPVSIESTEIEQRIGALLYLAANKLGTARVFSSGMGFKCYPEDPTKFRKPDVSVMLSERIKDL